MEFKIKSNIKFKLVNPTPKPQINPVKKRLKLVEIILK